MRRSLLIALILLLISPLAFAQDAVIAPSSLSRYVGKSSLDAGDLAKIKAYVNNEVPKLMSGEASESIRARNRLTEDLIDRGGRVSPIFREEYSTILLPHLQEGIEGDDTSTAVLAAQVASILGTDAATRLLTDHVEIQDEPRHAVRLWATGGLAMLVDADTVSKPRAIRALRTVARATADEPAWPVHRRAFTVLARGVGNTRGMDAGQVEIRDTALELMAETAQQTLESIKGGDVELVNGLPVVTGVMQNVLLLADTPKDRLWLSQAMTPVLAKGHEAILAQWDEIRADPRRQDSAARFLDESELLLGLMTETPAQDTQLSDAVRSGNRTDVEAAAQRWKRFQG
ncbi:MAG: hypothetical protein MK101_05665 [Phycisphaerales bacterium]|nr:hypothetical protein [Phycisphaerales bacterium]